MSIEHVLAREAPPPTGAAALFSGYFDGMTSGELRLRFADGSARRFRARERGPIATMAVRRPLALMGKVLARGDIGFAEAYFQGHWDSDDLPALLALLLANYERLGKGPRGLRWTRRWNRLLHRLRDNHRRGSRRNIARHYDLGNDFYRLWLDEGMTYSSAVFDPAGEDDLAAAQERKYARLLDALDARPGQHILEIGCGWGGFAEHAARRGLRVTGITLSREQLAHARARIEAAGLADRVELRLQDYRDVAGRFDHAVSIEMIEAVGEAWWPTYFAALRRLVAPGGRIALQAITIADSEFERYRRAADFIQLYIFPGGMLPSPSRLAAEAAGAGLLPRGTTWHGADYAETLRRWRRRFLLSRPAARALGHDERFLRMWDYYLAYCEVGFDHGRVDLAQAIYEVPDAA